MTDNFCITINYTKYNWTKQYNQEFETVHIAEWYSSWHVQGSEFNPTAIHTRQTCRVCLKNNSHVCFLQETYYIKTHEQTERNRMVKISQIKKNLKSPGMVTHSIND